MGMGYTTLKKLFEHNLRKGENAAYVLNLDRSKILSSGKELNRLPACSPFP